MRKIKKYSEFISTGPLEHKSPKKNQNKKTPQPNSCAIPDLAEPRLY